MSRAYLLLLAACMLSCESKEAKEQRADKESIQHHTDSLAAVGDHGYYVATYIIGRFKTSRMKKPPFQMEIGRMDERLLQSPIALQLMDTLSYQLTYSLAGEQKNAKGQYDAVLLGSDFSLRFALDSIGRRAFRDLKALDYELRVYVY